MALVPLGKPSSYDPRSDSTVRVQIGRLRQKLAEYYSVEGKTDTFLLEIPKGQLRLMCRPMPSLPASEPANFSPIKSTAPEPTPDWRWRTGALTVVALGRTYSRRCIRGSSSGVTRKKRVRLGSKVPSEVDKLWAPFLASGRPLKISFESPMFIGFDSRRLFRDMDVNQWNDAVKSPEIAAVGKALKAPQIQQRYHYAPFQEVNSAFLLGKLLSLRKEAYLVRSSQLSREQMADTNWVFIGSPPFYGEVLAGIQV